ncbi:MAG: hypothetical protein AB8B64_09790 [Granulosicoccus sp.]
MHSSHSVVSILIVAALVVPTVSLASDKAEATGNTCGFSSRIIFLESAPRDRFTVQNTSSGNWSITRVNLDLSSSAGNLIFDVTADGAGVEVYQPYRSENGEAKLSQQPVVVDGDQIIELSFSRFSPGDKHQFSIDIDDQLSESELGQIRVSGGEITGAAIIVAVTNRDGEEHVVSSVFDETNKATLEGGSC